MFEIVKTALKSKGGFFDEEHYKFAHKRPFFQNFFILAMSIDLYRNIASK